MDRIYKSPAANPCRRGRPITLACPCAGIGRVHASIHSLPGRPARDALTGPGPVVIWLKVEEGSVDPPPRSGGTDFVCRNFIPELAQLQFSFHLKNRLSINTMLNGSFIGPLQTNLRPFREVAERPAPVC